MKKRHASLEKVEQREEQYRQDVQRIKGGFQKKVNELLDGLLGREGAGEGDAQP